MVSKAKLLEAKAIELVDAVLNGGRIEDSLVEAKADWPEPQATKTAWQLGGLANAALGERIVWLVGVDEDDNRLSTSVQNVEPSSWWQQLAARFDGVPPELDLHVRVPINDSGSVWALEFLTDQAPYVVKRKPGDSRLGRGVPWRQGGSTHPASQGQIHRSLVPLVRVPEIHPIWAQAVISTSTEKAGTVLHCECEMRLAVLPTSSERSALVLAGRSESIATLMHGPPDQGDPFKTLEVEGIKVEALTGSRGLSTVAGGGMAIHGEGLAHVRSQASSQPMSPAASPEEIPGQTTAVRIVVSLFVVGLDQRLRASVVVDEVDDRRGLRYLRWGRL